jgi:carbon storage regulator
MLVLTRLMEESIIIVCPNEDRILIKNVEIRGDKVRLGFEAPKDYKIYREEIIDKVDKQMTQEEFQKYNKERKGDRKKLEIEKGIERRKARDYGLMEAQSGKDDYNFSMKKFVDERKAKNQ